MKLVKFIKHYSKFKSKLPTPEQLEKRQTRERDLIETFANEETDLDYVNRWNVPLLKKKVKTKTMIIINTILVGIIVYLVISS